LCRKGLPEGKGGKPHRREGKWRGGAGGKKVPLMMHLLIFVAGRGIERGMGGG